MAITRPHCYTNRITVNGAKLTEARIEAQLRLEDVANHLGCEKSQVGRWEREELMPSEERILKMVLLFQRGDFVIKNGRAK